MYRFFCLTNIGLYIVLISTCLRCLNASSVNTFCNSLFLPDQGSFTYTANLLLEKQQNKAPNQIFKQKKGKEKKKQTKQNFQQKEIKFNGFMLKAKQPKQKKGKKKSKLKSLTKAINVSPNLR